MSSSESPYWHNSDFLADRGLEKFIHENSSMTNQEALHVTDVLCETIYEAYKPQTLMAEGEFFQFCYDYSSHEGEVQHPIGIPQLQALFERFCWTASQ
jgi:hypothetical protein